MRQNREKYEGKRAVVFSQQGLLTQQEINDFGVLVNDCITNIEKFLGIKFDSQHYSDGRFYYFVHKDIVPSYFPGWESRKPFVFMNGRRVKEKTDPYLHETIHAMMP